MARSAIAGASSRGMLEGGKVLGVSVEGVKSMVLEVPSVERSPNPVSVLVQLVILCKLRLQAVLALDAFNFSLNG